MVQQQLVGRSRCCQVAEGCSFAVDDTLQEAISIPRLSVTFFMSPCPSYPGVAAPLAPSSRGKLFVFTHGPVFLQQRPQTFKKAGVSGSREALRA